MRLKLIILLLFVLMSFNGFSQNKLNGLSTTTETDLSFFTPPKSLKSFNKSVNDKAFAFNNQPIINTDPIPFYSHTLNSFANRSLISEGATRPIALSWNQQMTVLYGVDFLTRNLISISHTTGESTHIADFSGVKSGDDVLALTIDENDVCYVVSSDENSSTLYRCDLSTGELTTIGSQSIASLLVDITAGCDGTLYGFDGITNSLFTISKIDGSVNLIGNNGIDTTIEFTSIMYDRDSGVLYQYIIARNEFNSPFTAFASLNSTSGEATLLSNAVSGIYNGAIKTSCTNNNVFKINPGINGTWFDPNTSGQGFLIDVLPDSNTFFIAWFTNDTSLPDSNLTSVIGDAGQRWLTAQGELGSDNSVTLDIFSISGGIFDQPSSISNEVVGSMTVTFGDCTAGIVDYTFDDSGLAGSIPIKRVVNDNVALCEQLSNATN